MRARCLTDFIYCLGKIRHSDGHLLLIFVNLSIAGVRYVDSDRKFSDTLEFTRPRYSYSESAKNFTYIGT